MSPAAKLITLGAVGGLLYFMLAYHIFFFGGADVVVIKKLELTFDNTFVSAYDKNDIKFKGLENVLNEALLKVGYDELLLERGLITEPQLDAAKDKIYYGE